MSDDAPKVPPWLHGAKPLAMMVDRFGNRRAVDAVTRKPVVADDPTRPECLSCGRRFIPKLRQQRICGNCRKKPEWRGLAAP